VRAIGALPLHVAKTQRERFGEHHLVQVQRRKFDDNVSVIRTLNDTWVLCVHKALKLCCSPRLADGLSTVELKRAHAFESTRFREPTVRKRQTKGQASPAQRHALSEIREFLCSQ
jgi:hypothetical protein